MTLDTVQEIVTMEKLMTVDSRLVAATGTVGPVGKIRNIVSVSVYVAR